MSEEKYILEKNDNSEPLSKYDTVFLFQLGENSARAIETTLNKILNDVGIKIFISYVNVKTLENLDGKEFYFNVRTMINVDELSKWFMNISFK